MEKRRSVTLTVLTLILIVFVLSGCSFLNIDRRQEIEKRELSSAYKYRVESGEPISIGMSKEQVIKAWGPPTHIYNKYAPNDFSHYSDESWIYTRKEELSIGETDISYDIYFKDNKLIKIFELQWTEKL